MSEPEDDSYHLVMPFVAVVSRGGPFEDDSYVAGYEMGLLSAALGMQPATFRTTIHAGNRAQADLLAMKHGYTMSVDDIHDGRLGDWLFATFCGAPS
jgi:hypothetical protein